MLRGCNELHLLDISQNKFTKKEAPILSKWITASATLSNLNLSGSGVPADTLKDIFSAVAGNLYLKDFVLNLSDNKIGIAGARVIASVANTLTNIASLELNDNDLGDEGIGIVAEGIELHNFLK
jgi:Ran GTPase-activating protein (RanGAP) involved in mRNA processing and transport